MTWMIQANGIKGSNVFVEGYTNIQKKKQYLTFRHDTGPFPQDWRERIPDHVTFAVYDVDHPLHIVCDAVGYIFFSEPALAVLQAAKPEKFETYPLAASTRIGAQHTLQSQTYYLVNPYREFSAIDIDRSELEWPNGHSKGAPIRMARHGIALRHVQVPDFFAEQEFFFRSYYFFSDDLKKSLCDLGTNPDVFDACV